MGEELSRDGIKGSDIGGMSEECEFILFFWRKGRGREGPPSSLTWHFRRMKQNTIVKYIWRAANNISFWLLNEK